MEDKEEVKMYSSVNGEHNILAVVNDKDMTISVMNGNGLQFYKLNRNIYEINRDKP